ncbi:hypothetical protein B0H19DRAFT_1074537 [Mycena capillaripes]|nr:hypothetical protein B0H19DRAFT_1074537 [Mycena capillaripes]
MRLLRLVPSARLLRAWPAPQSPTPFAPDPVPAKGMNAAPSNGAPLHAHTRTKTRLVRRVSAKAQAHMRLRGNPTSAYAATPGRPARTSRGVSPSSRSPASPPSAAYSSLLQKQRKAIRSRTHPQCPTPYTIPHILHVRVCQHAPNDVARSPRALRVKRSHGMGGESRMEKRRTMVEESEMNHAVDAHRSAPTPLALEVHIRVAHHAPSEVRTPVFQSREFENIDF